MPGSKSKTKAAASGEPRFLSYWPKMAKKIHRGKQHVALRSGVAEDLDRMARFLLARTAANSNTIGANYAKKASTTFPKHVTAALDCMGRGRLLAAAQAAAAARLQAHVEKRMERAASKKAAKATGEAANAEGE